MNDPDLEGHQAKVGKYLQEQRQAREERGADIQIEGGMEKKGNFRKATLSYGCFKL
ncbi:MAG: hypothetical protein GY820_15800 [Gammaproteobacteria bacterium]|nr:hypothetical protein [Gammaproteobacteria bacterium]